LARRVIGISALDVMQNLDHGCAQQSLTSLDIGIFGKVQRLAKSYENRKLIAL
jgi:hypothetical protein